MTEPTPACHQLSGEFVVYNFDDVDLDASTREAIAAAVRAAIAPWSGVGETRTDAYITWFDTQE